MVDTRTAQRRMFNKANRELITRGSQQGPEWSRSARSSSGKRFTWYVDLMVRQDVRGDVSDVETIDADAPPRQVTVALLKTVKSGSRKGELRPMTYDELVQDFEGLVEKAVRRHGLVPAKPTLRGSLRSIYRHREA